MFASVLADVFLMADEYSERRAAEGPSRSLTNMGGDLGGLHAQAVDIGRRAQEPVAGLARSQDTPTHEDLDLLAEVGWRIIIASAPVDAHRFQIQFGEGLAEARAGRRATGRPAAAPADEHLADQTPAPRGTAVEDGWQAPAQLAQFVTDYLKSAPTDDLSVQVAGSLGVLALTLLTLQDADERRDVDVAMPPGEEDADATARRTRDRRKWAHELAELGPVRQAITDLYRPQLPDGYPPVEPVPLKDVVVGPAGSPGGEAEPELRRYGESRAFWEELSLQDLSFLEFGTTSMILLVPTPAPPGTAGVQETLVLKCVLLTYARLPAVAEATALYFETYGSLGVPGSNGARRGTVAVHASSTNWIVMDRAPGVTLHDLLLAQERTAGGVTRRPAGWRELVRENSPDRWPVPNLEFVGAVVPTLLAALKDIYHGMEKRTVAGPVCHADLTPKNVMVYSRNGDIRITLIDLGRNHVTGRSTEGLLRTDEIYAAPELPLAQNPDALCDLYSLGQIIVAMCRVGRGPGRAVPDTLYSLTPTLARLVEDLIDEVPVRRLLVFGGVRATEEEQRKEPCIYSLERLEEAIVTETDALRAAEARTGRLQQAGALGAVLHTLSPLSAAPTRQRDLYAFRRNHAPEGTSFDLTRHSRWLAAWSLTSAAVWGVCMATVVVLSLRDAGVPHLLPPIAEAAQRRADVQNRLSALLTGLSFSLCSVKYYQGIYAGLTARWHVRALRAIPRDDPRGASGRMLRDARAAEFWVRANALVVGLLVVPVNFLRPEWWTGASALGITSAFAVNLSGYRYARTIVKASAVHKSGLISGDPNSIPGVALYKAWWTSMLCYVLIVWGFAGLLAFRVLHDTLAYAGVVSGVNIALFFVLKCSVEAEPVRVGLTRCYLAADRLVLSTPERHGTAHPVGVGGRPRAGEPRQRG